MNTIANDGLNSQYSSLESGLPPLDDMGVTDKKQSQFEQTTCFSIDWLSITIWADIERVHKFIRTVDKNLLEGLIELNSGGSGYRAQQLAVHNLRLFYMPANDKHVSLQMSGETCQAWGLENIISLCESLNEARVMWKASRLDLALDHQQFEVSDFWGACQAWDLKTRVHKASVEHYHSLDGTRETVYFGSRHSESFMRVYKKQVQGHEVFGNEYFTRCELQFRKERSDAALTKLLGSSRENWSVMAGEYVHGMVHVMAAWWENWIGSLERAWFSVTRAARSVQKASRWINKQVARSLAMVVDARSIEFPGNEASVMAEILKRGRDAYRDVDRTLVKSYRQQVERHQVAAVIF